MKKRLLTILLAFCMIALLVPTVLAAEADLTISSLEELKEIWIAQIGEDKYTSLQAAIDAANAGDTITVLGNVEVTESLVVVADDEITIDLNGFTVSMVRAGELSAYDQLIENKGKLTIEDSSENETGALTYQYIGSTISTGFAANTITNKPGATLTVNGGTIENKTTTGHTTYAIDSLTNGNEGGKDTTVNVNGGTIKNVKGEGRGIALRACLNSTVYNNVVNINGGELIGGTAGLQMFGISNQANKGTLTIEGGKIAGGEDQYSMYTTLKGADSSNVNIAVKDGEFSGYVYFYNSQKGSNVTPLNVEISGGTFDSGVYTYTKDADGNNVSIKSITGGTFAEALEADYIAEGYVLDSYVNKDGETVYGVEPEVTVTFNAGDGTGSMAEVVMPAGEYTLPDCGFIAPENYVFKAWKINDAEYASGAVVEIEEDTTVTAVYTLKQYEVVFKDGDMDVTASLVEHGGDVELPAVPKKEGYTGAWDHDGKNITANTEINAVYTINEYTITFMDENGVYKILTYKHGETVTMPEVPAKDGYTVTWETTINKATGDATIKAVYTENSAGVPEQQPDSPQTGDNSNLWLWFVLLFVSGASMFGITLYDHKRKVSTKR